ncbi:hypothetical protein KKF91_19185 [Myxococcota bacterium]|nr:hypothetical protein [Myxococcota bacterium]MBU1432670.1 hypothetical protein [Myxococcota bacterium]MBU1897024.1 hypothetical protein [Myxococcota bacterium]
MRRRLVALALGLLSVACSTRNYTHYLIEPTPEPHPVFEEEEGALVRPLAFGSTTAMKVRWNDGQVITEVEIPMLASGQRIVIEHSQANAPVEALPATRLVPPKPSLADKSLVEAYRERGLRVKEDAPEISLSQARTLMETALKEGNYQLGLEWCELALARYPSHPEFMRAKGSILYLMGEREKAIEVYEAVEEIESTAEVRQMLEKLRKGQ